MSTTVTKNNFVFHKLKVSGCLNGLVRILRESTDLPSCLCPKYFMYRISLTYFSKLVGYHILELEYYYPHPPVSQVFFIDCHPDHSKRSDHAPCACAKTNPIDPRILHRRQPTLWLHDLCLEAQLCIVMSCSCLGPRYPPPYLLVLPMSHIWHSSSRYNF